MKVRLNFWSKLKQENLSGYFVRIFNWDIPIKYPDKSKSLKLV